MMPSLVKAVLPSGSFLSRVINVDATYLLEEAWNCHPYCKTVMTNGYLSKERFRVIVESRYVDNDVGVWLLIQDRETWKMR